MCRWRSALNYLAGLVYGDGAIYYYRRNNEYFVYVYDADRGFLERVGEEVAKAVKVSYTIVKPSKKARYYRLQFTSKRVYDYIAWLLEKRPRSLTKNFVRGLVDAEGTVYVDAKGRVAFELGIADQELAMRIKRWLEKHGIRATYTLHRDKRPNRRVIAKVRVRGWENVEKMFELLKPLHPKLVPKFQALRRRAVHRPTAPP